jgi:hypothetical protein
MSAEKSELRAAGMHEVGVRLDDLLEAARKEVLRCEGAALGLFQCAKAVNDLNAHVDLDVSEGKYDLETAGHVKRYLSRASQVVQNLGVASNNSKMASAGQVQMAETMVTVTKKMFDAEVTKREQIVEAERSPEAEDPRRRPTGVRPTPSIKEQRLAEEAPINGKPAVKGRRKPRAIDA